MTWYVFIEIFEFSKRSFEIYTIIWMHSYGKTSKTLRGQSLKMRRWLVFKVSNKVSKYCEMPIILVNFRVSP